MEDIERVTPQQLSTLRKNFFEKVTSNDPGFHPDDLERVKNDDLWLRRFIAQAEQSVEAANTLLYECCQWRKEFGVNDLDHTKIEAALLEKGTLFIRNKDVFGKKLLIFKAKTHQKGTVPLDQMQKFIVYFFERIEKEVQSDQISIVFDMKDTGWQNMDMDFVRYLITLYPYFVNYLMIFEMPWLLNAAWKIIKGWLPPKFVDRVKFVDKKTLKEWVDVDNQLAEWGGMDGYTYKFEAERSRKRILGNVAGSAPEPKARKSKPAESGSEAGTPLQTPSPTRARTAFQQGDPSFATIDHSIAEVDERIVFKPTDNNEYSCKLQIRNVGQGSNSVIFKIKTTSPERYRVRPTLAVVPPGGTVQVPLTTQPGISAGQIQRDRFQVQVCIFPSDPKNAASAQSLQNSSFEDLKSIFKKLISSSATIVDSFKVNVSVEPRAGDSLTSAGLSTSPVMNDEKMGRLEEKIDQMQMLMYVILAALMALIAVIFVQWMRCGGSQIDVCSGPNIPTLTDT